MEPIPSPKNPTLERPYASFYEALHKIRPILPDPVENSPDGYARRDQSIVEQIAQLVPATGVEAELAAHFVAASEYGLQCLREARQNQDDEELQDQLVSQSVRMGRDARGYLASLQRVQALRMKREQTEAGAVQADRMEEAQPDAARADKPATGTTAANAFAALAALQGPATAPPAAAPPPATPEPRPAAPAAQAEAAQPAPARVHPPAPQLVAPPRHTAPPAKSRAARPLREDDWPEPDWAAEAERYAIIYTDRARLIRRLGGLPSPCTFGPPDPQLVRALLAGTTPTLRALDAPDPVPERRCA
jgi:hypothetical protein